MNKFPLYAALEVSQVWRFDGSLEMWILRQARYARRHTSAAVPTLGEQFILDLIESSMKQRRPTWAREARSRIRERIQ